MRYGADRLAWIVQVRGLRLARAGRGVLWVAAWFGCVLGGAAEAQMARGPLGSLLGSKVGPSPVRAELLASVTAVSPGARFDLAVRVTLDEGWHVYWTNPGEAGLPTTVEMTVPDGFEAGPVRYPSPSVFVTPPDIVSYGYEREATLVIPVRAPEVIAGDRVVFSGAASWLQCKDACELGQVELTLTLPVAKGGEGVQPANETVFAEADRRLPLEPDAVAGVAVEAMVSMDRVRPGDALVAAVIVTTHAVADLEVAQQQGRPMVFVDRVEGLMFGDPIASSPEPTADGVGRRLVVRVPVEADSELAGESTAVRGVIVLVVGGKTLGVSFGASVPVAAAGDAVVATHAGVFGTVAPVGLPGWLERLGLAGLLVACGLYGLALNATPCVLPILSIKVVGFVQQAREGRGRAVGLGLAFGAGVVLLFVALGFLAAAGGNVLQYPAAVIALGAVVMALALSMLGVYTLSPPRVATDLDGKLGGGETVAASFSKGMLAPVLGFACTGPFMAGAFGWATQQPAFVAVLAFVAAGVGMALPYVVLSAVPGWHRLLPKPGPWMITFERIVAFLLLAMVIWLLHPLVVQIGATGLEWTLAFLVAVAGACWVLGKGSVSAEAVVRWKYRVVAAAIVVLAGVFVYGWAYPLDEAVARQKALRKQGGAAVTWDDGIPWRMWSADAVSQAVSDGKVALVDVTAAYCSICKSNKKLVLETEEVRTAMRRLDVMPFEADFTFGDDQIAALLHRYGRAGPPLYLVYAPGKPNQPTVLPVTLSKNVVIGALTAARGKR